MQLFHLVHQYQETGDVSKLMADAYEMLRYLPGFGKAATACEAARVLLLPARPGEKPDEAAGYAKTFAEAIIEADDSLDMLGIHPVEKLNHFGYFPHGYTEGNVVLVFGWDGNRLTVAKGSYDETVVTVDGDEDTVHAMALPFVALVKAVLVLATEAVRAARLED